MTDAASAATDTDTAAASKALRRAATLLVLRDGPDGPQVLMVRRAERAGDHSSGAFVFPGGTLDAQDAALHPLCAGLDDAAASQRLGVPAGGLDFYIGAIRESFEEAGLLFASDAAGRLADLNRLPGNALAQLRAAAAQDGAGWPALLQQHGWQLAAGQLAYHSHWLTPLGLPKRFDTRFFVAVAPADQTALHDSRETTDHIWVRPADALDSARGLKLVPVTRRTLQSIAGFASAQACVDHARQQRNIPRIFPRLATGAAGRRPVMPDEPAYAEIGQVDPGATGLARDHIQPAVPVRLSPRILRVTAANAGLMTGPGTNTYLVGGEGGEGTECGAGGGAQGAAGIVWAVIDPGPADADHLQAILAAADSGTIKWILATHTHKDHSPGTAALAAATGAQVLGRLADHAHGQDNTFAPSRVLQHGERLVLGGASLRVIHTPGHASNHLCFLLEQEKTLFTGDHVMQGSTVVIHAPDGNMQAYLASLQSLLDEDLDWLAPGHGFLVAQPHDTIRALIRHRLQREAKVVRVLREQGPADMAALLAGVYDDVSPRLHPVAEHSLQAHLIKLAAEARALQAHGRWQLA